MDREAAVLRAEMSRTRAELDQKLTMLQAKVGELRPRRVSQRYMSAETVERVMGGVLTLVGLKMAWSHYRSSSRRHRLRAELAANGRW